MSSIKEQPKSDIKPHKRKRSLSGIDSPLNEPDDFETYKIDKNIVERLKLKQIESLFGFCFADINAIY